MKSPLTMMTKLKLESKKARNLFFFFFLQAAASLEHRELEQDREWKDQLFTDVYQGNKTEVARIAKMPIQNSLSPQQKERKEVTTEIDFD